MKKIMALIFALAMILSPISQVVAQAQPEVKFNRISGKNRYITSVEASKASVLKSSKVIIASGNSYADTLSGGNLVNEWGAPILLVGKNHLPNEVKNEIKRIEAKDIYLLGGTNTIENSVEKELKKLGKVHRIAGRDRYETSKKVLELLPKKPIGVASGANFADALSATPFLKGKGHLLLVNPAIDNSNIKATYVFGGTKAVPGFSGVQRFSGSNRYETALKIAEADKKEGIILVDGDNYPDALSASIIAYDKNMSILLVNNEPKVVNNYFKNNFIENVVVVGGKSAVPEIVVKKVFIGAIGIPPHLREELGRDDIIANLDPNPNNPTSPEETEKFTININNEKLNITVGDTVKGEEVLEIKDKATGNVVVGKELSIEPIEFVINETGNVKQEFTVNYKGETKKIEVTFNVKEKETTPTPKPETNKFNLRVDFPNPKIKVGETLDPYRMVLVTDADSGWAISRDKLTFSPAEYNPTKAGTVDQEFTVSYKGQTEKFTLKITAEALVNTTIENLQWTKIQNSNFISKGQRGVDDSIKVFLKTIYGANAVENPKMTEDAKKLGQMQAETDSAMPLGHFPVFDGYRVIGYNRLGDATLADEMLPMALNWSLDYDLDLSGVTEYGFAIHTASNKLYGLMVVKESQVKKGVSKAKITSPNAEAWQTLADGRKIAPATNEVKRHILQGINEAAKYSIYEGIVDFKDNDPLMQQYAYANAKDNAINNRLRHTSKGQIESIGYTNSPTNLGLKGNGVILMFHNAAVTRSNNQGLGVCVVQETNGTFTYFISLFAEL